LALAIDRSIVPANGGELELQNASGGGLIATIILYQT